MGNPLERRSFDLGWLIGLIDGEGCFTLNKKRSSAGATYYFPTIQITNTNVLIIQKVLRIVHEMGVGCYNYSRVPKVGKVYHRIEICGLKRVKRFMDEVGDLFECRRSQSDLLRQYVELRLSKDVRAPVGQEERDIAALLTQANEKSTESSETNTPSVLTAKWHDDRARPHARA